MKNNMLKGDIVKTILIFALPIMASALLQYSYNLIDNIISFFEKNIIASNF